MCSFLVKGQNDSGLPLSGNEEPDDGRDDPQVFSESEDYVDFIPPSPEEEMLPAPFVLKSTRYTRIYLKGKDGIFRVGNSWYLYS